MGHPRSIAPGLILCHAPDATKFLFGRSSILARARYGNCVEQFPIDSLAVPRLSWGAGLDPRVSFRIGRASSGKFRSRRGSCTEA